MKKRSVKNSNFRSAAAAASGGGGDDKKEEKLVERRRLVKYEALPEYLQDNEFIRNYYRCEWPIKDVIFSIFSLHNETLNIWTHLLGFMIFAALMIMSLTEKMSFDNVMATIFGEGGDGWLTFKAMNKSNGSDSYVADSYLRHIAKSPFLNSSTDSNSVPLWPWFVFLGGAMSCLICSSISHLFACHSKRFYYFFWRLDYVGISLMIVCSFFPPIYYTLIDQPYWRIIYLSSITLVGILVVITLLAPVLSSGRFRSFRAALFFCMGFSGVIPATHALLLHRDHPQILVSLGYEIAMGLLYATGAVFYVTRIPERWRPGAFDIVGQSHQIFHVFVVAAALAHCAATLVIMDWRRGLAS
ncbi:hypothetical protein RD792_012557 [Penstemon davidsonii]|uniref:Heptahelical transmembrane protein 2 n=1 Tax=Penstemon davidsonii TaxID=160366 RepID=A0ABR0CX75_9LAMI|nr:hypothetical protein RD792_012557 [Penstemon davidsonii]